MFDAFRTSDRSTHTPSQGRTVQAVRATLEAATTRVAYVVLVAAFAAALVAGTLAIALVAAAVLDAVSASPPLTVAVLFGALSAVFVGVPLAACRAVRAVSAVVHARDGEEDEFA